MRIIGRFLLLSYIVISSCDDELDLDMILNFETYQKTQAKARNPPSNRRGSSRLPNYEEDKTVSKGTNQNAKEKIEIQSVKYQFIDIEKKINEYTFNLFHKSTLPLAYVLRHSHVTELLGAVYSSLQLLTIVTIFYLCVLTGYIILKTIQTAFSNRPILVVFSDIN